MKKQSKPKNSKKKRVISLEFNDEENEFILSALYAYAHIAEDDHQEIRNLIGKIERQLSKQNIAYCVSRAEGSINNFAMQHHEEGRDYQYNHDHRWDWKNRYVEVEPEMEQLLIDAWKKRLTVWMEYPSNNPETGKGIISKREVDIYSIDGRYIRGYCHLRGEERTFRMDRIIAVRKTKKKYKDPNNVVNINKP